jgi:hypothetical protein
MQSPNTPAICGTPSALSSEFILKMCPAPRAPGKLLLCSGKKRPLQSTR